jgi:hypothetical protein
MNEGRRKTTDRYDSDSDGISDWLSHVIYWLILMALIHVSNMSCPLSDIVHEQGLDGREAVWMVENIMPPLSSAIISSFCTIRRQILSCCKIIDYARLTQLGIDFISCNKGNCT